MTKLIICGNAKARMVAGDPEPDPSASECVNFLDLFDIKKKKKTKKKKKKKKKNIINKKNHQPP
ncbi:hypothetical protein RZN32_27575, partial [Klebsiella pneumoniae]|nr:hypothetical protein [Klebsiella pneumoniae]